MSILKWTEIVANAATIAVAALLAAVLVSTYVLPRSLRPTPVTARQVKIGSNLSGALPDVNWAKNGRTLVLGISTQCHFCTESAPFFRVLSAQRARGLKIVAVLPQPATEALAYLAGERVRVDRVEQLSLPRIGVIGTPTMMLVDAHGTVDRVWVGELQPDQQRQVLAGLGANVADAAPLRPALVGAR